MMKIRTTTSLAITIGIVTVLLQGCVREPRVSIGGKYLSTTYGSTKRSHPHTGVDYEKPEGAPVLAPADGEVTGVSIESPTIRGMLCGRGVNIWHTGQAAKHMTMLCHMKRVNVKVGDRVRQGQVIGSVGTTGCRRANNCIPHLHFAVLYDYRRVDPGTRIGGCYDKTKPLTDPEKPLVYPVRC